MSYDLPNLDPISHCENVTSGNFSPAAASNQSLSCVATPAPTPFRYPRPEFAMVERERFRRSDLQIRTEPTDLDELTASLRTDGQIYPVFAIKTGQFVGESEMLDLLDGQRRLAASERIPELQSLACFIFEQDTRSEEWIAFQLVTNIRENLSNADRARAVFQLFELSKAKSVNEFVKGNHGLAIGDVWLRNLVEIGAAEKSDCPAKREIFARVRDEKLGIARASQLLARVKASESPDKPSPGRPAGPTKANASKSPNTTTHGVPPGPQSTSDFVVAEQYRIPLSNHGGLSDWFLGVIALKRPGEKHRDHPIEPAALKGAATELLQRASKDDN